MKRISILALAILFCCVLSSCAKTETSPQADPQGGSQAEPQSETPAKTPLEDTADKASVTPADTAETQITPDPAAKADDIATTVQSGGVPKFEDYPVREKFSGRTAPVKLNSETSMFKTRFREAAKGGPNFAGRYIVATWGCGTDCLMGGVIDAKTGNTYLIPFSICCIYEKDPEAEKVEFRSDSRLIKFNGLLNENESEVYRHYYLFENGKFVDISKDK